MAVKMYCIKNDTGKRINLTLEKQYEINNPAGGTNKFNFIDDRKQRVFMRNDVKARFFSSSLERSFSIWI